MLTGESDGIRKREGDRVLSGSFCIVGLRLLRGRRGARAELRREGRRRGARVPPPALAAPARGQPGAQGDHDRDGPARRSCCCSPSRSAASAIDEAAQTATAGLVTLIPEGLVLLMSVTLAVAAVRLARMNTLVQQMSATEALAAVDTICVDKTGTLTDGDARPGLGRGRRQGAARRAAHDGAGAASRTRAGERNRTLRDDRRALSRRGRSGSVAEVPFSSAWKWSGLTLDGGGSPAATCWARPTSSARRARSSCRRRSQRTLEQHTAAGRRVVAFGEARGALPDDPAPRSRRRGSSRAPWSCSRSSCAPTPPRRSSSCASRRST